MVSGSRHRNSTVRLIHGSLSLIQIIVGTSSTSMAAAVSTPSSRVTTTRLISDGVPTTV